MRGRSPLPGTKCGLWGWGKGSPVERAEGRGPGSVHVLRWAYSGVQCPGHMPKCPPLYSSPSPKPCCRGNGGQDRVTVVGWHGVGVGVQPLRCQNRRLCYYDSGSNCRQTECLQLPESQRIPGHLLHFAAHQGGHHSSERRYHPTSHFTVLALACPLPRWLMRGMERGKS